MPAADNTLVKKEFEGLMTELSETLTHEYEALRTRDIDGLEAAVERKSTLIARLESTTDEVYRSHDTDSSLDLLEDWPELREMVVACTLANRTNGGAIELNRGLVANILDTLYGVTRVERTYDAHGHFDQQDAARSVGHA